MKYHEMMEREAKVQEMIEQGLMVSEMARELSITPQSMSKFLRTRGWKPKVKGGYGSLKLDKKKNDPKTQARKEARKKINSSVDRSAAAGDKRKAKTKG